MNEEAPAFREALPVYEVEAPETERIPAGYKQTEVGVIPEDWEVKAIAEFAEVKGGKRLPLGKSLIEKATAHP